MAATAAAALAGCSAGTPPDESREFRADPVALRSPAQDEFVLSEAVREELRHAHTQTVGEDGFVRRERFARAAEVAASALPELVHGEE